MKQQLIFTLIAATLAGGAVAAQNNDGSMAGDKRTEAAPLEPNAQQQMALREHYIRVAEAVGFEVLGTSNPGTVALNEMVLTVRPMAAGKMSQGYDYGYRQRSHGEHHDDD
jgi:hypothetical protein